MKEEGKEKKGGVAEWNVAEMRMSMFILAYK